MSWIDEVKWDAQGLVPVIAQEVSSGDVLMFAWMNRDALARTVQCRQGNAREVGRVDVIGIDILFRQQRGCAGLEALQWQAVRGINARHPQDADADA